MPVMEEACSQGGRQGGAGHVSKMQGDTAYRKGRRITMWKVNNVYPEGSGWWGICRRKECDIFRGAGGDIARIILQGVTWSPSSEMSIFLAQGRTPVRRGRMCYTLWHMLWHLMWYVLWYILHRGRDMRMEFTQNSGHDG